MANTNAPFGFRPIRYFNGTSWSGGGRPYYVPSSYATNIFIGDPVVQVGDSNTTEFQGFGPGVLMNVNIGVAGSGNLWTGICVGIQPVTRESATYHAASTEQIIFVEDDPNVVFAVQDDGFAVLDHGTVGLNACGVAGAGSTATGRSAWALDAGTSQAPRANAADQLYIIGGGRGITNDIGSKFSHWEVLLNKQTFKPAAALGL